MCYDEHGGTNGSKESTLDEAQVARHIGVQCEATLADAGVVDEKIDAAPGFSARDDAGQRIVVGRLERQDQRLAADFACDPLQGVGAPSGENDRSAPVERTLRDRLR